MIKVAVGIPAYNEAHNIKQILLDILSQKEDNFELDKIIVISDGSSDDTVKVAKEVKSSRIEVLEDKKRKGKVIRLNELFGMSKSFDVLVQLDADVRLKSDLVLKNLVHPITVDPKIGVVFGAHFPLEPKTFIERLAYFGAMTWERAIEVLPEGAVYHASGQIRAFSKKFLSEFFIPEESGSIEDVYSYFFAIQQGYKTFYSVESIVLFRLPSNFSDYINQMSRFVGSPNLLHRWFSDDLLRKHNNMNVNARVKGLLNEMRKHPFYISFGFCIIQAMARISALIKPRKPIWDIASSSKFVN